MACKRDCYKERVKSQFLPKVQELTRSSSLVAGLEPVLWRILAGKKHLLVSLPAWFSHSQQLLPECRLSAALVWLSLLVHSFLMCATATCSNSCCFRSVITRVFGFCLVWTGEKVADAAACCRQVCRSEIGWQPPAPPTLEVSSCIWMQWHMNLACPDWLPTAGLWDAAGELAMLPLPWRCQAQSVVPQAGAALRSHRGCRSECCWCSSLEAECAYNDYVRTRRTLSREVSAAHGILHLA